MYLAPFGGSAVSFPSKNICHYSTACVGCRLETFSTIKFSLKYGEREGSYGPTDAVSSPNFVWAPVRVGERFLETEQAVKSQQL